MRLEFPPAPITIICLSGVTRTPTLSTGTPVEPPRDDSNTAGVAVCVAFVNERPDESIYQIEPSPELTAIKSSPKLSSDQTGT